MRRNLATLLTTSALLLGCTSNENTQLPDLNQDSQTPLSLTPVYSFTSIPYDVVPRNPEQYVLAQVPDGITPIAESTMLPFTLNSRESDTQYHLINAIFNQSGLTISSRADSHRIFIGLDSDIIPLSTPISVIEQKKERLFQTFIEKTEQFPYGGMNFFLLEGLNPFGELQHIVIPTYQISKAHTLDLTSDNTGTIHYGLNATPFFPTKVTTINRETPTHDLP